MRLTVEARGAGKRLDRYLATHVPNVSRAAVMKYLKEGQARLNGRAARPGLEVNAGDEIDLPGFEERIREIRKGVAKGLPEVPRLRKKLEGILVLYEDPHMIVVDKPPGLVVHPGKEHAEGLDDVLREHFGPSVRLVHRLDRDTSGVLVVARGHPENAQRLAEAFKAGDADKTYYALVSGVPDPAADRIELPLLDTKQVGSSVKVSSDGKAAVTEYKTLQAFDAFAWLEVRLLTGRRHQIRVHLAHAGHPLALDHVYGSARKLRLSDIRPRLPRSWKNPVVLARLPLHAARLTIRHPKTGEEMSFEAPLPADLTLVLELLEDQTK